MPQAVPDFRARVPPGPYGWDKSLRSVQVVSSRDQPIDDKHIRPIGLVGRHATLGWGEGDDGSEGEEDDDDEPVGTVNNVSREERKLQDITRRHRDICKKYEQRQSDAKSVEQYLGGREKFQEFLEEYRDVLGAVGDKEETLLHHFARNRKGQLLVRYLVGIFPDLVHQRNQDGYTAPHIAGNQDNRNQKFIKAILKTSQKIPALGQECGNGNLLHIILQSMLPIVGLVHHALDEVSDAHQRHKILVDLFACRDKKGQTPLHVAINTIARHNTGMTTKDLPQMISFIKFALTENSSALSHTDHTGRTPLHLAVKAIGDSFASPPPSQPSPNIQYLIDWVQDLITRCPREFCQRTEDNRLPYELLGSAKNHPVLRKLTEDIKRLYMRELSVDELKEILYDFRTAGTQPHGSGPGVEKTIYFDLSNDAENNYTYKRLTKLARHVQFESILHHVDLPCLTVSGGENLLEDIQSYQEDSRRTSSLPGRVDFVKVFQWLRSKGVSEIIDVSVVDDCNTPHCEEAIEVALRGFGVEILNWNRFDMPSDAIFNAAPGVRELYLYSSSNNEVLRGWSAPGGLEKLKKLEKLHLSIQRGVIPEERITFYLDQFKQRLREIRPEIEVVGERMMNRNSPQIHFHSQATAISSKHPWVDTMDHFALIVKNFHRHLEKYAPTVKVAIIDDGIDPLQANLQENIEGGTSFHHRPGRPDRPIDYWSAPGGHGTEMAKLICRICPKARLYIIRLGEGHGENGVRQIKPETAIKAIKWATNAGVHIISMSWSINQSKMSRDLYNDFQKSIRAAYDKGITMFCAASDYGNTSVSLDNNDLPAAFSDPLKIGAATIDGGKWSRTGAQKLDFYLPGENLPLRDQMHSAHFPPQSLSGSSLATAVAAGLAALLQYCMGTAARQPENKPVFRTDDMQHAFKGLSKKDPEIPEVHKYFGDTQSLDTLKKVEDRYAWIAADLRRSHR
ncbi:hypothetical protein ABZX51_005078 [Aspergillus tubingensis]